jgi:hypothetical protein
MNLKAALLATARGGAFLLVAACGGGGADSDNATGAAPGTGSVSNNGNGSNTSVQYVAVDLHSTQKTSTDGVGIGDGEQVGAAASVATGGRSVAVLWRGSASSLVSLHPNGFTSSDAAATSGGMQAGTGYIDGHWRALKWAGSAASVVELDPTRSWYSTFAKGIAGDQIVGWGNRTNNIDPDHALLWTSRGVTDLHPSGFQFSGAHATDGAQQVGGGRPPGLDFESHALLWTGSAASVIDLNPLNGHFAWSVALGVSGGQQVGGGIDSSAGPGINSSGSWHALLWTGTAESVVDLHPSGCWESEAVAVAAGWQAGVCVLFDGRTSRALVWNGTAKSAVDLHAFLPPDFVRSEASGIDASGNVIGRAVDARGTSHAILWLRQ